MVQKQFELHEQLENEMDEIQSYIEARDTQIEQMNQQIAEKQEEWKEIRGRDGTIQKEIQGIRDSKHEEFKMMRIGQLKMLAKKMKSKKKVYDRPEDKGEEKVGDRKEEGGDPDPPDNENPPSSGEIEKQGSQISLNNSYGAQYEQMEKKQADKKEPAPFAGPTSPKGGKSPSASKSRMGSKARKRSGTRSPTGEGTGEYEYYDEEDD